MDNNFDSIFPPESGDNGDITPPIKDKPRIFKGTKWLITLLIVIAIVGVFVIGIFVGQATYKGMSEDQRLLDEVYNLVKDNYYEDITREEFDTRFTVGLTSGLDKYSGLISVGEAEDMYGVAMRMDEYNNVIVTDVEKSSTLYGVVYRGDEIVDARYDDGEWTKVKHLDSKVFRARLGLSSVLRLRIARDGELIEVGPFVKRPQLDSEEAYYLDTPYDGIGYIKLLKFGNNATDDFMSAVYDFELSGNNILILDLRDNGGGLVNEISTIIPNFMPTFSDSKTCMKIVRRGKPAYEYYPKKYVYEEYNDEQLIKRTDNSYLGDKVKANTGRDFKLVIVANDGTASSAEGLIGNIIHYMDKNDYIMIGEDDHTYGKGIAQTDFNLKNTQDYVLHLTIGKYYVYGPSGSPDVNNLTNIHGVGYPLDNTGVKKEIKRNILEEDAIVKAMDRARLLFQANLAA